MQFSINPWNFTKVLQLTYRPNHLCNNVIKRDDINKGPKMGGHFSCRYVSFNLHRRKDYVDNYSFTIPTTPSTRILKKPKQLNNSLLSEKLPANMLRRQLTLSRQIWEQDWKAEEDLGMPNKTRPMHREQRNMRWYI